MGLRRLVVPVACFAAGLLVASVGALWLHRSAPTPSPEAGRAASAHASSPNANAKALAIPPQAMGELMKQLAEKERADAQRGARAGERAEVTVLPEHVTYRVEKKLVPDSFSKVPYKLLGAWDEKPKDPEPGNHRAFVLVVDPSLSNDQLEQLVRDVEQKNDGADQLDIRVYDRADAATRSQVADGGAYARQHMVAHAVRDRSLHVDVIRIRGRRID